MDKSPKIKESLLERAFAEIMPEVKFIDVTHENDNKVAGKARQDLEIKSGKKVTTRENYLKQPQNKKLQG